MYKIIKESISNIFRENLGRDFPKELSWERASDEMPYINIYSIENIEFLSVEGIGNLINNPFVLIGELNFKIEASTTEKLEQGIFVFLASLTLLDKEDSRENKIYKKQKIDIIEGDSSFYLLNFILKRIDKQEQAKAPYFYIIKAIFKAELTIAINKKIEENKIEKIYINNLIFETDIDKKNMLEDKKKLAKLFIEELKIKDDFEIKEIIKKDPIDNTELSRWDIEGKNNKYLAIEKDKIYFYKKQEK